MNCPKCNSTNVNVQVITEKQQTGCITILFYFMLAITLIGLFVLIPIMLRGKKQNTITLAVCQSCGHQFQLNKNAPRSLV